MPTSVFYLSGSLSSLCSVVAEQYFVYLKEKKRGRVFRICPAAPVPTLPSVLLLFYYCRYYLFVPRADGLSLLKRYRFPRGQFKISFDGRWLLAPSLSRDSDAGRRPFYWKQFEWIFPLFDRSQQLLTLSRPPPQYSLRISFLFLFEIIFILDNHRQSVVLYFSCSIMRNCVYNHHGLLSILPSCLPPNFRFLLSPIFKYFNRFHRASNSVPYSWRRVRLRFFLYRVLVSKWQ